MRSFDKIMAFAAKRKGGERRLESLLSHPLPLGKIRRISGDRWLAEMTKCIFQSGFNWRVIESKWAGFETAFEGFDVARWTLMTADDVDRLMKSTSIVRNIGKIRSVGENAAYLSAVTNEYGSVGAYFAAWRERDYLENLDFLQKNTSRMGGRTGQIFLRRMGVSTLIFTPDVLKALAREGVIGKAPASKSDWISLRHALDRWVEESGRSLTEISQILAYSVD